MSRGTRLLTLLAMVCSVALAAPALPAAGVTSRAAAGALPILVHRCDLGTQHPAACGSLRVPLDYTDVRAATIKVAFGWIASSGPSLGTIVAQEGGPGYPATGTAADFETMLGPLLRDHNLLVVDARGTGRSTPIDCEPLQSLASPSPDFQRALTRCGRQLDHTFRDVHGGWVHASDLFTTANTARDTARVLTALKLPPVELYGDSYGTYFAQTFLARYPHLVSAVVLDSAYEARDLDPWYTSTVTTAHRAFNAVCARAVGCPAGSSWHRIGALAALLRAHPISGDAVGTDARRHHVRVDVTALVNIVNDAGYDTDPYRQLDAAARAYLYHRDPTPLLRLYLQDIGYDYSDYHAKASYYSDGLYFAVACTDYPQLFDMRSTPAQRRRQLDEAITKERPGTFAPFTVREWLTVLPYTETFTGCLSWPSPTHRPDPPIPAHASMDASHVPVLILNGELDSLTPAAGGAHIARQIGPDAQHYVAANTVHLVALENSNPCGRSVVQAFLAAPHAALDTSCLAAIPPIRAVPDFARTFVHTVPAAGEAPVAVRRAAAVAVAAAGDAVARYNYVDGNRDLGLRGGTVAYHDDGTARLSGVRWTLDSTVSGVAGPDGHATLRISTPAGPFSCTATWGRGGYATVHIGSYVVRTPAP